MNNSRVAEVAPDFSSRERERGHEFSVIWKGRLDAVFADVAPYYDFASNLASLGLCNWWRRRFVSFIEVAPGDRVLDVCAGTNGVGIGLLQRQPDLRVFALDRSAAMQAVGGANARALGFHIESIINDAHKLPFPDNCFDVVTLQWASRHLQVVEVFSEIMRVLKPGGRFHHCDMLRPESKPVEVLYSAYLRACVPITALLFRSGSDAWHCRNYFVRAIQMFYSAAELTDLLRNIGFSEVSDWRAPGGILACHKAVKA
jgi:demethylmenaquinone methyltransferase/2-methoxy-6-polyprenyl-1,4-benzoquinol methylase